ncbi:MAG: type II toxin-antitoxin system Phd/YefM family antitoxin [Gemmatimonadales bacterium]
MAKDTVPISVFKAQCLALLKRVRETGTPLVVTKFGEPVAEVIPPALPAPAGDWMGSLAGKYVIIGDIMEPIDVEWEALKE